MMMAVAGDTTEAEVRKLARSLYRQAAAHKPSLFEPQDWIGKIIAWSLEDESLRAALFQFVDVLPSLDSSAEIGRHLEEYFARVDHAFGRLIFLAQVLHAGRLVAPVARQNVRRLARRFIVEEEPKALISVLAKLREEPAAFTLDVVGEATVSDREALAEQARYLDLLRRLAPASAKWAARPQIDEAPGGPLPRVNVSVKLSSLCARFDPLDPDTESVVRERLRLLLREASTLEAALTIDMEQYAFKDLTLEMFRALLEEEEFSQRPKIAIALQAYLRDGERDLTELIRWAEKRRRRIGVRLVKGAYWDSEIAWAKQKGWAIPVFLKKAQTDASYERMSRQLLEHHGMVDASFGSHNIRSLAHAIVVARQLGIPKNGYEIQMLYGMAEPIRKAIIQNGQRVRIYVPVGELLPGMSYLIRRLMENTSNTSFLRQTYVEAKDIEALIATPAPGAKNAGPEGTPGAAVERAGKVFCNEPLTDFSRREDRVSFGAALRRVRDQFPKGSVRKGQGRWLESVNPASPKEIVGRVALADEEAAEKAIKNATAGFAEWRRTPANERAEFLFRAADLMRQRRAELAAWELFEVGKGWREADADVAETIDYLEYYGRQMLRLAKPRQTQHLPGEINQYFYEPRGVAAVIAPWNFPLAILAGMTAAALVTGNCVIMKPAEQSPVMAAHLLDILRAAGLPSSACQLLQGGGELGAYLVSHPEVHLIAFTGSCDVGLEILRQAYTHRPGQNHVKRVVCEMGGKNAIIVDDDADLDEAIHYIIESAFGYQGQKCSAASRIIVVDEVYERVLRRLVEATQSLKIGPSEDPRHFIGPVIDADAQEKIVGYIRLGKQESRCVLEVEAPKEGFYVGPAIFSEVAPQSRLAQEEIFGPVLSVIRARDFADALEIANQSSYALTGGLFSRSPAHTKRARREFRVGNLYINRGITGAIVERQPFGGLKLSGIGSKAGGPDYLLQFLEPRTISENTLRHGFVPPEEFEK